MTADTIARFRGFNPTAGEDIRELREELLGTCWSGAEKAQGKVSMCKGTVWRMMEMGSLAETTLR